MRRPPGLGGYCRACLFPSYAHLTFPPVFRLRLGKALNYEYNEDSQTGLFQRRDPREGGPALDIERGQFAVQLVVKFVLILLLSALNKLEKVALRMNARRHKPLVLVINNVHFFNNDESGRNILLQFQQRAESWAASGTFPGMLKGGRRLTRTAGIVTLVFTTCGSLHIYRDEQAPNLRFSAMTSGRSTL